MYYRRPSMRRRARRSIGGKAAFINRPLGGSGPTGEGTMSPLQEMARRRPQPQRRTPHAERVCLPEDRWSGWCRLSRMPPSRPAIVGAFDCRRPSTSGLPRVAPMPGTAHVSRVDRAAGIPKNRNSRNRNSRTRHASPESTLSTEADDIPTQPATNVKIVSTP